MIGHPVFQRDMPVERAGLAHEGRLAGARLVCLDRRDIALQHRLVLGGGEGAAHRRDVGTGPFRTLVGVGEGFVIMEGRVDVGIFGQGQRLERFDPAPVLAADDDRPRGVKLAYFGQPRGQRLQQVRMVELIVRLVFQLEPQRVFGIAFEPLGDLFPHAAVPLRHFQRSLVDRIEMVAVEDHVEIGGQRPVDYLLHPVHPGRVDRIGRLAQRLVVPAHRDANGVEAGCGDPLHVFLGCGCAAPGTFGLRLQRVAQIDAGADGQRVFRYRRGWGLRNGLRRQRGGAQDHR